MVGRFTFGQYRPSDSFGHRLDPRAKLMFAVFLMILAIFVPSPWFYLMVLFGLFLLLTISGISAKTMFRNARPFVVLVGITALYHLIFSGRDSETLIDIYGVRLTIDGVYLAATFSLRVLVFLAIAFFVTNTTLPSDLAEAMVGWLRPLKKYGLPIEDIMLILFIAMRFVPVLAEEFDTIKKAQQVRGIDFKGGPITKGRKMIFLLIPIFQSAIRRADDLALAIESRGYVSGAERSRYFRNEWSKIDYIFLATTIPISLILFYVVWK